MDATMELVSKLDFVKKIRRDPQTAQTYVVAKLLDGSLFDIAVSVDRSGNAVIHDNGVLFADFPELSRLLEPEGRNTIWGRLFDAALGRAEVRGGMICLTVSFTPQSVLTGVVRYWQILHDLMDLKTLAAAAV